MQNEILKQIDDFVEESSEINQELGLRHWSNKVFTFLKAALGEAIADDFLTLRSEDEWDELAMRQGLLQGISAKAKESAVLDGAAKREAEALQYTPLIADSSETRKVFVVHGHDEAAKEATARFLEKLGLQPIILHEQASGGRTIIEKFEKYSNDVGFAVVLLTPDDLGATQRDPKNRKPRARQNVVLELGYFLGKLTRNRVCALYRGGIELPSDIQGVIYVEMDDAGAWKAKLAQELVQAKCPINLQGLVSG